ncbi:MAG: hypothetical protein PVH47_07685 [Thiohalocapsa sp.]|jgi:hypothetical protein
MSPERCDSGPEQVIVGHRRHPRQQAPRFIAITPASGNSAQAIPVEQGD